MYEGGGLPIFGSVDLYTYIYLFRLSSVRRSVYQYKKDGDFADLLIVNQAIEQHAKKLFSFDKKFQKNSLVL